MTRGDLHAVIDDLVPAVDVPDLFAETASLGEGPGMTWEHPSIFRGGKCDWAYFALRELPPFIEVVGGASTRVSRWASPSGSDPAQRWASAWATS